MATKKELQAFAAGPLQNMLADIQTLIQEANASPQPDYAAVFATFVKLLDDAIALAPPAVTPPLSNLRSAVPGVANPTARDWAGFFAAIAAFMKQLLPIILPLIVPVA